MKHELFVRGAAPADICKIAALEANCFPLPWREADFAGMLSESRKILLVCEAGGEFAGYIASSAAADESEVLTVAVLPKYRGCGVGFSLICALAQRAAHGGARALFLEVRESNAPARALYERCGFTECGRRRGYYQKPREDALLYRLDLKNKEQR